MTTSDGRVTAAGGTVEEVEDCSPSRTCSTPPAGCGSSEDRPTGSASDRASCACSASAAGGADLGAPRRVRAEGADRERRRPRARARHDGRGADHHPRAGRRGGGGQVPRRLPARRLPRARRRAGLRRRARASYGWDLARPRGGGRRRARPRARGGARLADPAARLAGAVLAGLAQVSRDLDPGIPSADFSSEVVDPAAGRRRAGRVGRARRSHEVAGDRGGGRRPFSVGVSRVAPTLTELPVAYGQARRAVEIGRRVHGARSTTYFDQLGIYRLLALVPESGGDPRLRRATCSGRSPTTPEAADLRTTLQVLLDTNFNVAEAARLQFFHYNTMRYRVGEARAAARPALARPAPPARRRAWPCGRCEVARLSRRVARRRAQTRSPSATSRRSFGISCP